MMIGADQVATEAEQLDRLTPEVLRAYAAGDLAWSAMRERFGVQDFTLVLRRLGEEELALPRAPTDRPTLARGWLREVLELAA